MERGSAWFRRLFAGPNAFMVAALSAATIILIGSAVIGARNARDDAATTVTTTDPTEDRSGLGFAPGFLEGAEDDAEGQDDEAGGPAGRARARATAGEGPGGSQQAGPRPSEPGATRVGVLPDHFRWGVHAPTTLNNAPLNIAEQFVIGMKGYITHLNAQGGVHGRKVRLFLEDDKYTTAGGREARDALLARNPFILAGTLGVDQIHIVAEAARGEGIPYFASGGPEPEWRDMGMFQVSSSYDQWMDFFVDFLCSDHMKQYMGGEEIRLGTTVLDSPFLVPVEQRFAQKVEQRGCVVTPIDERARGKIRKPDEQTTYRDQLVRLSQAYNGQGANLVVPLQDPISTSRQVQELRAFPSYNPKWSFSSFVHDADTTLALMGGDWTGVRGLSGGCYYLSETAADPGLCKKMGEAHRIWVNLGQVTYDENAGGCAGGRCSYNYNQDSWVQHGQGGSAGYQLVHFWLGAMREIGADPTREKFVAALRNYQDYSDLLTGPITFRGSDNIMRGAYGGVVVEGQSNLKYRQVTEITPGIVQHF